MIDILPFVHKVSDAAQRSLTRLFGSQNERVINGLKSIVEKINGFEDELKKLSDEQLKDKTAYFKEELKQGKTLDDILPEAFAVVREASCRTLQKRHYDVQMMGGIMLHRGTVIEMMTGEGKTLVATCPAYLNALEGKGVHVITVNDYLARRDSEWMGEIYRFLGLSVGYILQEGMDDHRIKRDNYRFDITYCKDSQVGFDYMHDNMKIHNDEVLQRKLNFAIIDEVDSTLIDEARTPLIISGAAEQSDEKYIISNRLASKLTKGEDFTIDEKETSITLTEKGIKKSEEILGIDNMYSGQHMDYPHFINNALRAHNLQKKDKDYVVQNGDIIIVDEHTGRLMSGRRWSDGLHQAIEAKEGVPIQRESQTLATITFQNLFKLYNKISGMTGTAMTEAGEFHKIYKLDVVAIPPNRDCVRMDQSDLVYGTLKEKYDAIIEEIEARHKSGQPVLVGTASIESSELIARRLSSRKIPHEVLNAKQHAREALIIAQAGSPGAVTVATNMAGRGTDIVLGGNAEVLVESELGRDAPEEEKAAALKAKESEFKATHDKVLGLGGLFVLGTERHESRRIDNQLRGRSGRQGDPGESRFYLSLEDDLMRRFAPPWAARIMQKSGLKDGEPIEHPLINKSISNAQKKVEEYNFEIRKNMLEYDEVMNEQRKYIYGIRNNVLNQENLGALLTEWAEDAIALRVHKLEADLLESDNNENVERDFYEWVEQCCTEKPSSQTPLEERDLKEVEDEVLALFKKHYSQKRETLGDEKSSMIESFLLLQTIDQNWKDHLYNLDHVKDAIGWRGYAQVDPKVEYKKEAFSLFRDMLVNIKHQVLSMAIRLTIKDPSDMDVQSVYNDDDAQNIHQDFSSMSGGETSGGGEAPEEIEITQPIINEAVRVGRNDPCPCGSGKKFKQCCGTKSQPT